MLHPESELRCIDLIQLSSYYTTGQLMQSKMKLFSVLLIPFQSILTVLFALSIVVTRGSWLEFILGLLGMWSIFVMVCVISIWWTTYGTHFKSEGLLLIRLDRYESKILQQLYHYPRRLIISGLLLLFLISFFFDHKLDEILMDSTLPVLVVLALLSCYVYWHTGGRYSK